LSKQPSNNWTSNLPDKVIKKEFTQRLIESKDLFQRLMELVEVLKVKNNDQRIDITSYKQPAWSEFQADANGYERALTEVLLLLKFTKE